MKPCPHLIDNKLCEVATDMAGIPVPVVKGWCQACDKESRPRAPNHTLVALSLLTTKDKPALQTAVRKKYGHLLRVQKLEAQPARTTDEWPCRFRGEVIETLDGVCRGPQPVYRCSCVNVAAEQDRQEGECMLRFCVRLAGNERIDHMTYCNECSYRKE